MAERTVRGRGDGSHCRPSLAPAVLFAVAAAGPGSSPFGPLVTHISICVARGSTADFFLLRFATNAAKEITTESGFLLSIGIEPAYAITARRHCADLHIPLRLRAKQ